MKKVYLDYASLTPIDKGVLKAIKKYSSSGYSNPSALHASGVSAKKAVLDARERIAKALHAHADEIMFTSGGTEANHLALQSALGKKILISAIEHSSIMHSSNGNKVKIPVDKDGLVDLEFLKKNITADTGLVSIMMVNNEIGAIEPLREIAKIVRDANKRLGTKILFHTDACQAFTHFSVHVEKLGADIISLDGHKMHGPRGMGILYVKRGSADISRAGTNNVPGIMGLAYAIDLAEKMRDGEFKRLADIKKSCIEELRKINPAIKINGDIEHASPHILNISISGIDNEFLVLQLDARNIECSTKSACLKDEDESYVLKAIGADSRTSVRFSFGRQTTMGDVQKLKKALKTIIL